MGLEKTFGTAEKVVGGKKLEVVSDIDSLVKELFGYFHRTKKESWKNTEELRKYFFGVANFVETYKLSPKIISYVNDCFFEHSTQQFNGAYFPSWKLYSGIFLAALMQSSYNQGFNEFSLGEVRVNGFGALLEGQKDNRIKIKAKKILGNATLYKASLCNMDAGLIDGSETLRHAVACCLKTDNLLGNWALHGVNNCLLESKVINGHEFMAYSKLSKAIIGDMRGNGGLWQSEDCVVEIGNYVGNSFGLGMHNCQIYSPDQKTLSSLTGLSDKEGNIFMLKV